MQKEVSARISYVHDGSPAALVGLREGDELLAVNSLPVTDVFDYAMKTAESLLTLTIRRDGRKYACFVWKDVHEDLGLEFEEALFDGVRQCTNDCVFCFVRQMPEGLRPSLYLRDDDYRLSFAHGNYVTLTNLTADDMAHICAMRIGRLYVSVHTTDPDLRVSMMRSPSAGRVMQQLTRLAEAGVVMHTQIVLCPGLNDGEHLARTVRDLSALFPSVQSVAVVPVGLTQHRNGLTPIQPVDPGLAREVVAQCVRWQREFLRKLGSRFVFPSDELYLLAGQPLPSRRAYEGFPQLEDGVGVSRLFLDTLYQASRSRKLSSVRSGCYVLVTGVLAAPLVQLLADLLGKCEGVVARVCIVKNEFLGHTITVVGLLSGRDVSNSLKHVAADEQVLIPDVMLNDGRFLDGLTVEELQAQIEANVTVVPTSPMGVVRLLSSEATCRRRR